MNYILDPNGRELYPVYVLIYILANYMEVNPWLQIRAELIPIQEKRQIAIIPK